MQKSWLLTMTLRGRLAASFATGVVAQGLSIGGMLRAFRSRGDSPTLSHQQMVPEVSLPIGVYEIDKANGFQGK